VAREAGKPYINHDRGIRGRAMKALALLGALLLAACAAQQEEWTKPGASATEIDRDSQACEKAARVAAEREAFRGVPAAPPQVRVDRGGADIVRSPQPGAGLGETALRSEYYRKCMQGAGYELAPKE
jgi:hypothetical protein